MTTDTYDALFGQSKPTDADILPGVEPSYDPPNLREIRRDVGMEEREELFEEDAPVAIPVALTVPTKFPGKHEMMTARPQIIEELVGKHGALKTYLLMKFIEKLLLDKDQGIAKQIKDAAEVEYLEKYGKGSTEIMGVKITPRSANGYWNYPPEVCALETELEELKRKVAGAKKAAEIDGRAKQFKTDDKTISVTFL